jgi:PST family polysaccharide transporter
MSAESEGREGGIISGANVWRAFAHGVRDNLLGEFAVQTLRVGGTVVLARNLGPANFGLLKVLVIVAMFATLFSESGIPDAVIQRRDLNYDHEATAWWLSLSLVITTVTALYFAAPLLERAMAIEGLAFATRLLCIPLLLEGTAIIPVARLARSLRFTALAIADVAAEIAFLAVAFALLWQGHARLSLPGGLAARFATHAVAVWCADHKIPFGRPRLQAARELGRFAVTVLGGRIVTVASGNADFLLVGRLLGTQALGYYSIAWDLLRFVPDRLHRIVGRVALPAFCRLSDDDNELGSAYCNFLQYLARLVLPVGVCVAISAPHLLTGIYGYQWLPAVRPMRLLACGLALAALRMANIPVYYAKNYPGMDLLLNGMRLILVVAGVLVTAHTGLTGVSAAVGGAEGTISIAGQYAVCMITGLHFNRACLAVLPSVGITVLCGIATLLGSIAAGAAGLTGLPALALIGLATALSFLCSQGGKIREILMNAFGYADAPPAEGSID